MLNRCQSLIVRLAGLQASRYVAGIVALLIGVSFLQQSTAQSKPAAAFVAIARGKLDVEGGLISIHAPVDSIFSEVNVAIGDQVKADALIAQLDPAQARLEVELAAAEVAQGKKTLANLKSRVAATESLSDRLHQAVAAGAAERQQAENALQELNQLKGDIATALSNLDIATIKQRQAELTLSLKSLHAPLNSKVVKINARKGTSVDTDNQTAFVLLPDKPLLIRAELNESYLPMVHVGSKATVTLDASPDSPALKASVTRMGSLVETSSLNEETQPGRVVECILEFEQPQPLLFGQNVLVRFYE